jgi:Domain of unknown function (DUF5615)
VLRLLADENFNNKIVWGLKDRSPGLDIVRVQDVGLIGVDDPEILDWAAGERRILVTHDVTTITHYAYLRVLAGKSMPGVFAAKTSVPIGKAIEDLLLLAECSGETEWEGQIRYLPL